MDFSEGFYASLDVAGETHFLTIRETSEDAEGVVIGFAMRSALTVGRRF